MEAPPLGPADGLPSGTGPAGRAAAAPVQRVRIAFAKRPEIRYIGHLDLVRMWERAFRRARLPLAYTQGYTPHPRLAFAAALALGATGEAELMDVYLRERLSPDELVSRLVTQLPPGCRIATAAEVELPSPSITSLTRWAEYRVEAVARAAGDDDPGSDARVDSQGSRWSRRVPDGFALSSPADSAVADGSAGAPEGAPAAAGEVPFRPPHHRLEALPAPEPLPSAEAVQARIAALLAADHLPRRRERDGKKVEYDLRPLVLDVWLIGQAEAGAASTGEASDHGFARAPAHQLGMRLRADAAGAGRPEEVAAALGLRARLVHRTRIGLETTEPDGLPVPPPAAGAA